jgi:hypothetical protein
MFTFVALPLVADELETVPLLDALPAVTDCVELLLILFTFVSFEQSAGGSGLGVCATTESTLTLRSNSAKYPGRDL